MLHIIIEEGFGLLKLVSYDRYCLGDKSVEVEFQSDPKKSFSTATVNYEDPNINVSIPVFSIHGNHDDPTGQKQISAMDLLATSGLVNYFGRCKSYDEIEIEPICLQKGDSKLSLFGLSHIKDERLGRLFIDKKVMRSNFCIIITLSENNS